MKTLKRVGFIALFLGLNIVHAGALDLSYEGNESEWKSFCSGSDLSEEDEASCDGYTAYLTSLSSDLEDRLEEIDAELQNIAANLLEYSTKISNYTSEIAVLEDEVAVLTESIAIKEEEITEKQAEIDENQAEVDALYETFENRMVQSQSSMRLNQYIDFIMGASDFDDLIRRTNGISAITEYDQKIKDDLKTLILQLEADRNDLQVAKSELETDKDTLNVKLGDIVAMKYEAEQIAALYEEKQAELEAEGNQIASNLGDISATIKLLIDDINDLPTSSGFTRPISGGYISEGVWYYSGGGIHLGTDYANNLGTPVYAVGNGVVVFSTDGCGYGYLGDGCGTAQGGTWGGGNQVYLITKVGDSVYGVRYIHLLAGTPVASGTIVYAGETIAQMGSSGNSTGPHLHIEIIYLGTGNLYDYVNAWASSGSLSFGCGFGSTALNYICEWGASAPCRINPASVLG
ncbi:MAG: peptidoglycan DD-metalloendopeptidase family protein [Erysipelotrichaceae bacterium]